MNAPVAEKAARGGIGLLLLAFVGCASRADVVRRDRQLRGILQDQRRQLQSVQNEVERLRSDVEGGSPRTGTGTSGGDRLTELENRLARLEREVGSGNAPPHPPAAEGEEEAPPAVATVPSTLPPKPAAPPEENGWRREVSREQGTAGTVNVPERGEYLGLLDGLARQDCPRTVPQLNGFAAKYKESPLADNALYWAARCYAVKGDHNQAISKFYDVVTRYPKGDKAAAALWAQGNLFVEVGDSPDARLAFSKLIRDYPSSEEAARARQKLTELED